MSTPVRVLEIRSVRGTGGGPEKTILRGAAQADPTRYQVTVCYVRDARDDVFGVDARAAQMGVDYVEIRERRSVDASIWPALRRLVRDRRIDIVHAHDYKTDLLAWLLHRWDGVRVLATAHGWSGCTIRERRLYYPGDKRLLARLPRVIAVSAHIRDELVRHGAALERVVVILNGIDHQEFRRDPNQQANARAALSVQPREVLLGAVGRLEVEKRFDILIEVFAQLHARRPEVRLIIAGEGSLRKYLERLVSRLGLQSVCRLIGHVHDIRALHHALDLFVQTSDTEGTPNAVLEAMALETPLVATAAGGTAELITDRVHGLIVPTGSRTELLEAIESALRDPGAAMKRAEAARSRVEQQLSFRSRTAAVAALYDELMAGPARQVHSTAHTTRGGGPGLHPTAHTTRGGGPAGGRMSAPAALQRVAKQLAFALATVVVAPLLLSYRVRALALGRDRALEGSSQFLSFVPGLAGQYLRRAFLARVLRRCHRTATVEFGTVFSQSGATIDEHVYIGPRCHLGLVHLERNVLLAAGVHVPSGGHTHAIDEIETPIREQGGMRTMVRIGEGSWIGSAAVVMADVGANCVIGAGAVVTRPLPECVVAAGVPARIVRSRQEGRQGTARLEQVG